MRHRGNLAKSWQHGEMYRPVIRLYELEELALIVECNSGVRYTTQAGGNYCLQPETEGALVPLGTGCAIEDSLAAFYARENVPVGLSSAQADALDLILRTPVAPYAYTPTFFLEVDRHRLADSMEAWLFVTIKECPEIWSFVEWNRNAQPELERHPTRYPCAGFGRRSAVLVWTNSD